MNRRVDPPTPTRTMTRRRWLVALTLVGAIVLDVTVIVLLTHTRDRFDPFAFRQQQIAFSLLPLCMLCLVSSFLLMPPSRVMPRGWGLTSWVLVAVLLMLDVSALAISAFAPPTAADLAATLVLIVDLGNLVLVIPFMIVFGIAIPRMR